MPPQTNRSAKKRLSLGPAWLRRHDCQQPRVWLARLRHYGEQVPAHVVEQAPLAAVALATGDVATTRANVGDDANAERFGLASYAQSN
jgi:hypothetical protein